MDCVACGSAAVTERPDRTARGYRRFRCHECGKGFNERSAGLLNRAQYPSDVIALVVLWRLRYRLTLRDLSEMFQQRGLVFSYEAVRDWEAKLASALADELRRRRHGEWQEPGALRRELDCLLAESSVQYRGSDLKHAVGATR
jgi:putative transposase